MTAPNPNDPPKPPETPASSAPAGGPSSAPTEWRVPENHPDPVLRGKTASEVLAYNEQLRTVAQQALWQLQAQQQPAPPPTPTVDPSRIGDDDLLDGKTFRAALSAAAQPFAQGFQQVHANMAQMNLNTVRSQFPDAFQRYGGEIMALVQRLPLEGQTVDNLNHVVKLVLGNHLAEERQRWEAEHAADPTLRGGGQAGLPSPGRAGPVTESDELPAEYRTILKEKGVDDRTLREFFVSQGMDETAQWEWFERAKKYKNVITERSIRGG